MINKSRRCRETVDLNRQQYISKTVAAANRLRYCFILLLLMVTPGAGRVLGQTPISSLSDIIDANGNYILNSDFSTTGTAYVGGDETAAVIGSSSTPFTGTIDGQLVTITGTWDKPLFDYINGATIKNVIIGTASVSGNAAVGSIAGTANGASRIYNCGILDGTVGSTGANTDNPKSANACGGLIGILNGTSRVINCYSYATITGGNCVAGIVGYNNVVSNSGSLTTMVMNCMFYGDITGGNKISPVYGGNPINNLQDKSGLNTFNFYAYEKLKSKTIANEFYNCALAIEDRFLTRFEIYRQLLNSNKKLAAWYATGSVDNADQMAKWVLETADRSIADPKTYPVLKPQGTYPSIINPDFDHAPDSSSVGRNKGGKLGKTLAVTISESNATTGGQTKPTGAAVSTTSLNLTRTDMDGERFNFNYDKIQLPYYNDVGSGNYTDGKVVTGWKITSITGGTAGTYTASDTWGGYNFADRKCTNKDKYSVSGRVFAQGAYWDVPYGVTAITIEPYWGNAAFIADERYDVVYTGKYESKTGIAAMGQQVESTTTFNGVSVKTSINDALGTISSPGSTVYDNAIVLVGNFHQNVINGKEPFKSGTTPFTLMSVDLDNDHEPDYSLIFHDNNRSRVPGIRFDFLNIPGTAQAQKPNSTGTVLNASVFNASSWFEITNTCNIFFSQFEYENSGKTANSPIILLGGAFDQFTSTKVNEVKNTTYLHVGGNAWFKDFANGTHSDGNKKTKHIPISVTGGDYNGFYLTGTYTPGAAVYTDDAECYVSGGHFVEAAGAGLEQINGNVRWLIYNADIENFYGGGINADKPIKGNVTVDIINSHVGTYCGGPKFGDMQSGKKVTTNANGCTFGQFFGAGFGGTSLTRVKYYDQSNLSFNSWQTKYTDDRGKYFDGKTTNAAYDSGKDYGKKGFGVATDFDYEFFVWTSGQTGGRFFVKFASFSLAQCNDVESNLKGCTINGNYYGGGSLGKVAGNATSVLDDCTVKGNVFGAGYSVKLPLIYVRNSGFEANDNSYKIPTFNKYSGMFEPGTVSGTTEYEWEHVNSYPSNGGDGFINGNHVKTTIDLEKSNLGSVAGHVNLTIKGNSKIGTDGDISGTKGNVYGGGDESFVNNNDNHSSASTTVTITGQAEVLGNVYGGGNLGEISGNTTVIIDTEATTAKVHGSVYGGGNLAKVGRDVRVNIQGGTVVSDVYGGGALADVNTDNPEGTTTTYTTQVDLTGGTVERDVYGGGLGRKNDPESKPDIAALVKGDVTVTVNGTAIKSNVYGCNNVNGTPLGAVNVDVLKTVNPQGNNTGYHIAAVFGGGNNAVYQPFYAQAPADAAGYKATTVTINGGDNNSNVIINDVFGGGNNAGTDKGNTKVDMIKGTVLHVLYGGNNAAGTVTGDVDVTVTGGTVGTLSGNETPSNVLFGGGYGAATNVNGNVTVNVGSMTKTTANNVTTAAFAGDAVLNGSVYGGGEQGKVNTPNGTDRTTVNLFKGTVNGDAYGGGLGHKDDSDPNLDVAAAVHGNVFVNLNGISETTGQTTATYTVPDEEKGCTVNNIFGANNVNGGPEQDITVHIYKTQHTGKTRITNTAQVTDSKTLADYDVTAVYGGGNKASTTAATNVIIDGCDRTSINTVYGGGNAADVGSTHVLVNGTFEIGTIFGGGNGAGANNPGANVAGQARTTLRGGTIHLVYGGSNEKGNIVGGTKLDISAQDPNCELNLNQIFGAGNKAEMQGDVDLVLGCMPEGLIEDIYAGARNADVNGNVSLTITSGRFGRVFGGNMDGGMLNGSITVNIEETGGCETPIIIGELYGGGNLAPYSVYGYNDDKTPKETGQTPLHEQPQVNVRAFTSIGAIYGGGYKALMVADPNVNINVVKGSHAGDDNLTASHFTVNIQGVQTNLPYPAHTKGEIGAIGNVFGGGNLATVIGNTTVNIGTESTIGFVTEPVHLRTNDTPFELNSTTGLYEGITVEGANITGNVYGGGNQANVSGNTQVNIGTVGVTVTGDVFGAGKGVQADVESAMVTGNSTIVMAGGTVSKSVYGGGELSQVGGNTYVNITGGTIGTSGLGGEVYGNVYGGGLGKDNNVRFGLIKNNTNISISGGTVLNNVYGGGAYGSVGTYVYSSNDADAGISSRTSGGTANVTITGGTIGTDGVNNGMVFGSSRGDVGARGTVHDKLAWVYDAVVQIGTSGAESNDLPHIYGSVFGSGENGHTYDNTSVTIHSGTVDADVYGGGSGIDKYDTNNDNVGDTYNPQGGIVRGTATVIIDGGHVKHNVYGAGAMGSVNGNTNVTVGGNAVIGTTGNGNGNVYAAARGELGLTDPDLANVTGTILNISGGTVWGSAFGGGEAGIVKEDVAVIMSGGLVKQDLYGGGALANTNTDNWDATKNGGQGGWAYAEESGKYTTTVILSGGTIDGSLYGGGLGDNTTNNDLNATIAALVYGDVTVVTTATDGGGRAANIFGCNNLNGAPQGAVTVNINGTATIGDNDTPPYAIGNVYGGGNLAAYGGSTEVTITAGTVNNIFGGGSLADVAGNVTVNINGGRVVTDVYGGGELANTNTGNWDASKNGGQGGWATGMIDANNETFYKTIVNLNSGVIGNAYGGALGSAETAAFVYGDVTVSAAGTAFKIDTPVSITFIDTDDNNTEKTVLVTNTGRIFGANNINGTPKGDIFVHIQETRRINGGAHVMGDHEIHSVYGGGNLADYIPVEGKNTQVLVDGCNTVSIGYVYGGGNSASVPQTLVNIDGTFEVGSVFGGGNGNDPIPNPDGTWSANRGANITKSDGTPGTGTINVYRGKIGWLFGGSNKKGLCGEITENINPKSDDDCPLKITNVYGAGQNADVESVNIVAKCPGENVEYIYGGSLDAHIAGDVTMTIIGGKYKNVFGGNDNGGSIGGRIEVNIQESYDCDPVEIDYLYGGGNNAAYPGNGSKNGSITVNIKSCTSIGHIYGGGRGTSAVVSGTATVNLNMTSGLFANDIDRDGNGVKDNNANAVGTIGYVFGGGDAADIDGNAIVNIATAQKVNILRHNALGVPVNASGQPIYDENGELYQDGRSTSFTYDEKDVLGVYITGNVFGGGNEADVTGNTYVNIGADMTNSYNTVDLHEVRVNNVDIAQGVKILGNVYGGCNLGSVGNYTTDQTGKPSTLKTGNTGVSRVTIKGYAEIGPDNMKMNNTVTGKPDDYGHVFGASKGTVLISDIYTQSQLNAMTAQQKEEAISKLVNITYVDNTYVTIGDHAFIKGSVYGGSENGHVLHNTNVYIQDECQIGNGYGVNRRYTADEWAYDVTADPTHYLAECAHWPYGEVVGSGVDTRTIYAAHDMFASTESGHEEEYPLEDGQTQARSTQGGRRIASDGHTFYGNVFGGGSGYYPYAPGKWNWDAGAVYGNTNVTVTGGHILTNLYGGNEMTNVSGKSTVNFGGTATLGVPRTLQQIKEHPVTCYLFGGGKGDQRVFFNRHTNVQDVEVNVTGGTIYGSVFGGGEDGHVMRDVDMNISGANTKIGTWGTSYVDGNVFGGGRGFAGDAYTAGNVGGSIEIDITGGTMLGSVYGGGRLGSVGYGLYDEGVQGYGLIRDDNKYDDGTDGSAFYTNGRGHIDIDISGGTIGNDWEYKYYAPNATVNQAQLNTDHIPNTTLGENNRLLHTRGGNVFAGGMGRREQLDGVTEITAIDWHKLGNAKSAKVTIRGTAQIKSNVYGGGEYGAVGYVANNNDVTGTEVVIQGGTIGTKVVDGSDATKFYYYGSVFGGGMGNPRYGAGDVKTNTSVTMSGGRVYGNVYGGGEIANVGTYGNVDANGNYDLTVTPTTYTTGTGTATVSISGGKVGPETLQMPEFLGHVFGGGMGETGDIQQQGLEYMDNMAFVANTDVTISGTALIKGSVYGGSMNGHVLKDTYVKIQGGQIGVGKGLDANYAESIFSSNTPPTVGETSTYQNLECDSWSYAAPYAPYDKYASSAGKYPDDSSSEGGVPVATDGHTFYGNVFGGGSGYFPYAPGKWLEKAGTVYGNTVVQITGGHILTSVYGGNEQTDVKGSATVRMTGGTLGVPRTLEQIAAHPVTCYLFGAGKGDQRIFFNTSTNVKSTNVEVSGTARIFGSVFGGGEDGHVLEDVTMTIGANDGTPIIGTTGTSYVDGNVFGGGRGFSGEALTAGTVGGNVTVNIIGGSMLGSVYGGGRLASVGTYFEFPTLNDGVTPNPDYGKLKEDANDNTYGHVKVLISGGTIGNDVANAQYGGNVFGGSMGRLTLLNGSTNPIWPKLAEVKTTEINISGTALIKRNVYGGGELGTVRDGTTVNISGGTINGDVFGGGYGSDIKDNITVDGITYTTAQYAAHVKGTVDINVTGGVVTKDIYGGGALASTNIGSTVTNGKTTYPATTIALNGGQARDVYGGGLGKLKFTAYTGSNDAIQPTPDVEAKSGDVILKLNNENYRAAGFKVNRVFGGNNLAGTPRGRVLVHVYATQNPSTGSVNDKVTGNYDVQAVYGGGNLSAYEPDDENEQFQVTIDGCGVTSIYQVYGGSNAAPVPSTNLIINGAYEIGESFGGGNGNDDFTLNVNGVDITYPNPGANVGYRNYTHYVRSGDVITVVENDDANDADKREANTALHYGSGIASTFITGGTIHSAFGGSNKKGNIRTKAASLYEDTNLECPITIDNTYGGGKDATMDGQIDMALDCVKNMPMIFGGSENADVDNDIVLNITNGTFQKVFGGNNTNGAVNGSITVNIEEKGCQPIYIDELYGGGYLAPYSIYGYKTETVNGHKVLVLDDNGKVIPLEEGQDGALQTPRNNPRINVISATYIGNIYGGGYKAKMVGTPYINVNMQQGKVIDANPDWTPGQHTNSDGGVTYTFTVDSREEIAAPTNEDPNHKKYNATLAIGNIGNIFGGGYEANVVGDTHIEIGTGQWQTLNQTTGLPEYTATPDGRSAATITGDVYGGGNKADVTKNTWITIANGLIMHNVYGGGKEGSVGTLKDNGVKHDIQVNNTESKINYSFYDFGLSWPVKLEYENGTGDTHINITGGRIGTSGDDNGDVFGAGKGKIDIDWATIVNSAEWNAMSGTPQEKALYFQNKYRYDEAYQTNVNNTYVTIDLPFNKADINSLITVQEVWDDDDKGYKYKYVIKGFSYTKDQSENHGYFTADANITPAIAGSVYGGAEDGHVIGSTEVIIDNGLIGHSVYGGGKGKGKYKGVLYDINEFNSQTPNIHTFKDYATINNYINNADDKYKEIGIGNGILGEKIYSLTAGKVYGNTSITMNGGQVMRSIFGGGNLGSVGKGNYSGGNDDYALVGYGEMPENPNINSNLYLWSGADTEGTLAYYFKNSGKTSVTIIDGTVGYVPSGLTIPNGMTDALFTETLRKLAQKDDQPTGNIFGGCRGKAAPNGNVSPRFQYIPEFFLGYVNETEVTIGDATHTPVIYGSVYGGGQDGHVRRDTKVTINNATIGLEYESGNITLLGDLIENGDHNIHWQRRGTVYGAGSGIGEYSMWIKNDNGGYEKQKGYNYSSGSVTRSTTVDIKGNTQIYENVYGGGAIASVGPPPLGGPDKANYNVFTDNTGKPLYRTEVNISGNAKIGVTGQSDYGGNVYGASRGSDVLYRADESAKFATDTYANVNITGGTIANNVFGGGQMGTVSNNTDVQVTGAEITSLTIGHDLFGGGEHADVKGNTNVNVTGGLIQHNVYGGGNEGSVGTWDVIEKHDQVNAADAKGAVHDFGLSWPYELKFKEGTGETKIRISGQARIGLDGDDDGDVFGASKGRTAERYTEALLYNVRNSDIEINLPSFTKTQAQGGGTRDIYQDNMVTAREITDSESGDPEWKLYINDAIPAVAGSVYGGGEDGHVYGNTNVTLKAGLVGHSIYGGGKGKGQYDGQLLDYHNRVNGVGVPYNAKVYSIVAGRVYGNTNVTMKDGYVMRSIYGGGNLGSVGIGNYAGGSDDYSTDGYGELPPESAPSLWTNTHFMNSGIATVRIESGTVGYICKENGMSKLNKKSDLPTGNVFGGCRGMSAPNYNDISPRYEYFPEFFFGYVNDARVIIGTADGGPTILGSVYGGGQDGHVRRDAVVTLNNGTIGVEYNAANIGYLGSDNLNHMQWRGRGNIYAAGSGTGEFEHTWTDSGNTEHTETGYNYSSGSVTGVAKVQINNGTVYQNVYGGGSLASIGPPPVPPARVYPENKAVEVVDPATNMVTFESADQTQRKSYSASIVTVSGGQVGWAANYSAGYGGHVYGASRGDYDGSLNLDPTRYASTVWTQVKINGTAHILGNVFGGGENGSVKRDTYVEIGGVALPQPTPAPAPAQGGGEQGGGEQGGGEQGGGQGAPQRQAQPQTNAATESLRSNANANFRRE